MTHIRTMSDIINKVVSINSDSDNTQQCINKKVIQMVKEKTGRNLKVNFCALHIGWVIKTVHFDSRPSTLTQDRPL